MQIYLLPWTLIFLVTLVVSLALTPVVRRMALRRGLVDVPGEERRVHAVAVPRLGGLAMYVAFLVGVLLTFVLDIQAFDIGIHRVSPDATTNERFETSRVILLLIGAGIITAVMAVDDIRGLKAPTKLIWQVVAALLVIVPSLISPGAPNFPETSGVHYDQGAGILATSIQNPFGHYGQPDGTIQLPLVLGVLFTLVWIVGITNTVNWIDGLDGLAAGVTLVACVVMFIFTGPVLGQYTLAYLPLIFVAAAWHAHAAPANDASGLMDERPTQKLALVVGNSHYSPQPPIPSSAVDATKIAAALLVVGIPMLDGAYLIVYRVIRGRSPMAADRSHLHHRLLDIGLSQQQVVVIFYLLSATFGVLALLPGLGLLKFYALVYMVIVLVGLLVYISRRRFDRLPKEKPN